MKRKIVRHGSNTLTVSLPAKWCKKFDVKGGNEIEVSEDGKVLKIATERTDSKKITIPIKGVDKYLHHYLRKGFLRSIPILYRLGYDEIRIEFDNPKVMDFVPEELDLLLGFEIIDQGKDYCVIRNVAPGLGQQFESILRRIFIILQTMAKDMFNYLKNSKFEKLPKISNLEVINNKLTNFCERILHQKGNGITLLMYSTISLTEQVADDFRDICNYYVNLKKNFKFTDEALEFFKEVINLLDDFTKLFYNVDGIEPCELTAKRHKLINEVAVKLFKTQPKDEQVLLHYLSSITNKIYHMTECSIKF